MTIKFKCPVCGMALLADDDMAGDDIRCPGCREVFPVPEASTSGESTSDETTRPARGYDDAPDPPPQPRPWRRRRRPPPPPSSGSSVLLWLAGIFGVLLVGGCGCCIGGYFLLPSEQWRTYQSPNGGYSADFPIKPNPNMQIPGMPPDPNLKVEGGLLWKRGECYAVMYGDVPPKNARGMSDEQLLRESVKGMNANKDVRRILLDEAITVSGFPGREVEYEWTDNGIYTARIVITNRRLYVAIGGGRFVRRGNANIRRFIDSFKITEFNQR